MSRMFKYAVSNESSYSGVSLEEEGLNIIADEILMDKQIHRDFDRIAALECLADVAKRIGKPTPTETALFRVCAMMSAAGTNDHPSTHIPAIESHKTISVEGFFSAIGDAIKAIFRAIKNFFVRIWNWFAGLFKKSDELDKDLDETIKKNKEVDKKSVTGATEPVILASPRAEPSGNNGIKFSGKDSGKRHTVTLAFNRFLKEEDVLDSVLTIDTLTDNVKLLNEYFNKLNSFYIDRKSELFHFVDSKLLEKIKEELNNENYEADFDSIKEEFTKKVSGYRIDKIITFDSSQLTEELPGFFKLKKNEKQESNGAVSITVTIENTFGDVDTNIVLGVDSFDLSDNEKLLKEIKKHIKEIPDLSKDLEPLETKIIKKLEAVFEDFNSKNKDKKIFTGSMESKARNLISSIIIELKNGIPLLVSFYGKYIMAFKEIELLISELIKTVRTTP